MSILSPFQSAQSTCQLAGSTKKSTKPSQKASAQTTHKLPVLAVFFDLKQTPFQH
jgi:hypothetical protein